MSYKARMQYLLTGTTSLLGTAQADVTQARHTDKYITLIQPSLHKVVGSHSHIRGVEIRSNIQLTIISVNPCTKSVKRNNCAAKHVYDH